MNVDVTFSTDTRRGVQDARLHDLEIFRRATELWREAGRPTGTFFEFLARADEEDFSKLKRATSSKPSTLSASAS